jgi:hypothetical protein
MLFNDASFAVFFDDLLLGCASPLRIIVSVLVAVGKLGIGSFGRTSRSVETKLGDLGEICFLSFQQSTVAGYNRKEINKNNLFCNIKK